MTAAVSTNENTRKINPALHNWKSGVRESMKFSIILLILHMVAVPAVLISTIVSIYAGNGYDNIEEAYFAIAIGTTALAAFLGIFAAVNSFGCLNDKSVVDMKLALPMNNTQRFLSNFLSGLFTYLAPFFSAQVVSLLICGYGMLFMEGKTFYYIYTRDNEIVRDPYICDLFGQVIPVLLKLIAGGTLCMLMLYVITVLITVCCGNKFEAIAYTILINILIPLTIVCVLYSMYDSLYGIDAEIIAYKFMMYVSVFGGIIASVAWAGGEDMLYGYELMNFGAWALIFFLITAALFALSFYLYKKRRAEQVSKPFVFKLAYYIVLVCTMFCIISVFMSEGSELVPMLITSGIVFMIFEVVTNRGFKRFWMSIIKYAATVVAVVAIIVASEKTDGFGAVQRVPSASNVSSIELNYGGFYGDFYQLSYTYERKLLIKDKANIEAITAAHQEIVDVYTQLKQHYNSDYEWNYNELLGIDRTFEVTYHLKTGGSFSRSYYFMNSTAAEILGQVDLSEEYKRQVAEYYKNLILDAEKDFLKEREEYEKLSWESENYYAYAVNQAGIRYKDGLTRVSMEYLVAKDFFTQLAQAYYDDIMAINEENYYHSELHNIWTLSCGHFINSLSIPESFTNTVELLDYFDFCLVRIENFSDEDYYRDLSLKSADNLLRLYTEDEYRRAIKISNEDVLHASYSNYNHYINHTEEDVVIVYDYDENYINLIRAAMPRNIVPENGYVIYVSGFTGVIPEELNSIAAGIQRSGDDEDKRAYYSQLAESLDVKYDYYY
ncbi:MAG: hypothetical protein IJ035_04320 [Oscillospiraceae bacterium]|nr:hypothetical protein [Oscillospiraceae bacterium]